MKKTNKLAILSLLFSLPIPVILWWEILTQTSSASIFEELGPLGNFLIFTPHIAVILGFIAFIQRKKYNKLSFYLAILGFFMGLIIVWAGTLLF